MKLSPPPTSATWLLERFDINESIVGDIIERYQMNGSTSWYWRQVVVAILRSTWRDIREHRRSLIVAVSAGWIVLLAVFGISSLLVPDQLGFWGLWWNVGPISVVPWTRWWESVIDSRLATLGCLGFLASGWFAARFRPTAMLAFAVTVSAWGLTSAAVLLLGPAWHGMRWFAPYREMGTFVFHSAAYLLLVAVILPLLVLIGGLAGTRPLTAMSTRRNSVR
jgi:hypothetical protein